MSTEGEPPDAEWFRQMADDGGVVFWVLRVQPDVAFEFLTDAVEPQLGCPAADGLADATAVLGRIDPEAAGGLAEALALQPGGEAAFEARWRHHDGRLVYARSCLRSRQRADGSVVLEGTTRDITHLRDAERDLRLSEERYRLLAENAWEVIWTMALDTTITYVSPAVERMRGFTPEEAVRQSLDEALPPESLATALEYFARLFAAIAAGSEPPVFRGELEYYRKDGSILITDLQVIPHVDAEGRVVEILGVTRDITERKTLEAELTRLAATDSVTAVWNRRHGEELLTTDLAAAHRHRQPLSLLMLDIDNFKSINDTYGHQTGDRVLIEVARRLPETLRGTDLVVRWGGEEFVMLLRHCALPDALAIAEGIRARIAGTPFSDAGKLSVSVSIGAAELRPDDDLDAWIARADEALYEAKRSGRNAVSA